MALRIFYLVIIFGSFTFGFHTRTKNVELRAHEAFNAHSLKGTGTEAISPAVIQELKKVKLEVYYETLCPASVDFFATQLLPMVEKLASFVDVRLVPYGHAKTWWQNGRYRFRCQHGPAECYGNRLQACVLDLVQNSTQAVLLSACIMQHTTYRYETRNYDYFTAVNWCSHKLSTPVTGVLHCVTSERGSVLLKGHGEATRELRLRYVPYVVLDGSTEAQRQSTTDLTAAVCQKLPTNTEACQSYRR